MSESSTATPSAPSPITASVLGMRLVDIAKRGDLLLALRVGARRVGARTGVHPDALVEAVRPLAQ